MNITGTYRIGNHRELIQRKHPVRQRNKNFSRLGHANRALDHVISHMCQDKRIRTGHQIGKSKVPIPIRLRHKIRIENANTHTLDGHSGLCIGNATDNLRCPKRRIRAENQKNYKTHHFHKLWIELSIVLEFMV